MIAIESFIYFTQGGFFLMMLLYCLVSYIVYQNRIHVYIMLQVIGLVLAFYIYNNKYILREVFIHIAYISFINSILYYVKHYTATKINKATTMRVQILALLGLLVYLVSFNSQFTIFGGVIIKLLFVVTLCLFIFKLYREIQKLNSILIGLVFFIISLFYHAFIDLTNSIGLSFNEWDGIVFKFIAIIQIVFLINALLHVLYSVGTEKLELEKKFFQQMQENYLAHLRTKQINQDINSNLHDDVASQLAVINAFNQLALQYIDEQPESAKKYIYDLKENIEVIPHKVEEIIVNEGGDETVKNAFYFKKITSILFTSRRIKYDLNIVNETSFYKVNNTVIKNLFLIYKEILTNIVRYSEASYVRIELDINENNIVLFVKDNGVGFNVSEPNEGYGLLSIRRRVSKFNGKMSIVSSKNKGCTIQISMEATQN